MVLFSRNANTKTTTTTIDNDLLYINNSNNNTSDKQRIAAALLEIEKRQGSSKTFTLPISNNNNNNINEEEYMKHFYSNTIFEKANEMKLLLYKYPDTLGEHYKNLVPNTVSFGLFWGRYYYKCNVETIINEWMHNELQFIKDQNQSTMMIMQTIQGKYHHKENTNYNNSNNIIDDDNTILNHQSSVQSSFNSTSAGEYEKINTSSLPITLPTSSTMTTNPLRKQKSFSRMFSSSFSSYRNKSTSLITNPVDTKDADASIAKTVVDGTAVTTNHTTTDPNYYKNTIENNNNNNNIDSSTIPESDPYYMAIFHLLGNTTAKLDACEPSNTELDDYDDDVYDDNDNDRYNQVSSNNTNKMNKKSNAQSPTRKSNSYTTPLSTPSKKKRTPSKKEQELMEEEKRIAECLQV